MYTLFKGQREQSVQMICPVYHLLSSLYMVLCCIKMPKVSVLICSVHLTEMLHFCQKQKMTAAEWEILFICNAIQFFRNVSSSSSPLSFSPLRILFFCLFVLRSFSVKFCNQWLTLFCCYCCHQPLLTFPQALHFPTVKKMK